jgi:hypothetical protein
VFNGSAVDGNIAAALADSAGNIVAATAASGTDAYQDLAFTAAYNAVGPATYYVLLQCNGGKGKAENEQAQIAALNGIRQRLR